MRISYWSSDVCSSDLFRVIEMKTAQPSLVDHQGYDMLNIGVGQVMSQVHQHIGLFTKFSAEQMRRPPILNDRRIEIRLVGFVFNQKLPFIRDRKSVV